MSAEEERKAREGRRDFLWLFFAGFAAFAFFVVTL